MSVLRGGLQSRRRRQLRCPWVPGAWFWRKLETAQAPPSRPTVVCVQVPSWEGSGQETPTLRHTLRPPPQMPHGDQTLVLRGREEEAGHSHPKASGSRALGQPQGGPHDHSQAAQGPTSCPAQGHALCSPGEVTRSGLLGEAGRGSAGEANCRTASQWSPTGPHQLP